MATPEQFYNALASEYCLLFGDWWSAAQWHGRVIAGILARRRITEGRLLDCTCGIGTQAARGINVDFRVCDVRNIRDDVEGAFDVVIS